jgi:hypothetical protein
MDKANTTTTTTTTPITFTKRVDDTVAEILRTRKGEHNIFIYPDLEYFRQTYPKVCNKRLEDNDIVLFFTYYEPIEDVMDCLTQAGVDVESHRKNGNLVVADAAAELFGEGKDLLKFLVKLERKVKALGKNYVSVFISMSVFMLYEKEKEMVEYEGLLDLSEVRNWKVLCCYHKEDDRLEESIKEEILVRHNRRIFGAMD